MKRTGLVAERDVLTGEATREDLGNASSDFASSFNRARSSAESAIRDRPNHAPTIEAWLAVDLGPQRTWTQLRPNAATKSSSRISSPP